MHKLYNPEGITTYNIVPGLIGTILTMTTTLMTALALTREIERGTMENLLAMPVRPVDIMIGKIVPYIGLGLLQVAVILAAAFLLFSVPMEGSLLLLLTGVLLFIAANVTLGYTFSTLARTQMQAMQMTFFFFLPSILLSGFMFPFRGMPVWAQAIGEVLPLTHFLRAVRGIMLKGNGVAETLAASLAGRRLPAGHRRDGAAQIPPHAGLACLFLTREAGEGTAEAVEGPMTGAVLCRALHHARMVPSPSQSDVGGPAPWPAPHFRLAMSSEVGGARAFQSDHPAHLRRGISRRRPNAHRRVGLWRKRRGYRARSSAAAS